MATTGADRSRRMRTVSPFDRRVRTTDAGSIDGRTDVVTRDVARYGRGTEPESGCPGTAPVGFGLVAGVHPVHGPGPARLRNVVASGTRPSRIKVQPR